MNIAFIGLGNMGGRMAQNLLKAGLKVYGYDLSEVAIQHFAEAGGVVCDRLFLASTARSCRHLHVYHNIHNM
ncbi:NAD(P)-binding domain-containing protein, partial [Acinetobacter baumannii]